MMVQNLNMPCTAVHMGVYLRRRYAFMPKHFLYHTKVSAVFHQMGGKGMAERMRRNFLPYSCEESLPLYHLEYGLTAQAASEAVQEKDVV